MTLVYDGAILVDQQDVWDALDFVLVHWVCLALVAGAVVVFQVCPVLVVHVGDEGGFLVVDADADEAYLAGPLVIIGLHHVCVVLHRPLAWRAPCRPEINEQDFALFVSDCHISLCLAGDKLFPISFDLVDAFDFIKFLEFLRHVKPISKSAGSACQLPQRNKHSGHHRHGIAQTQPIRHNIVSQEAVGRCVGEDKEKVQHIYYYF